MCVALGSPLGVRPDIQTARISLQYVNYDATVWDTLTCSSHKN